MTTTNTFGRQVVVPLTNKSGGGVIAGDVVVVGTANNDAFTTTTSAGFTGGIGIAQETIADNATGRVLLSGYAALVNTTASVTRQNFGTTSTTVKKAVDAGSSRTVGTFCQFLTGGTTPDAIVFNPDLGSSSGAVATDAIWDAAGDLVQGTGANTAAKLPIGTAGYRLVSTGSAALWVPDPGRSVAYPTAFTGDVIDGSSTTPFVDTSAFDTKEVLNSRVLHVKTLGASKDQKVRVTLGTTKAAAFDVTTRMAFMGQHWSAMFDTYLEVRLSTSADAQIAIARIGQAVTAEAGDDINLDNVRVGGSSISAADANTAFNAPKGTAYTFRFVRDGSNVITFFVGVGASPLALAPALHVSDNEPFTATVSGTLARVEYSIHTPSGPGAAARNDGWVDYLASV